MPVHLYGHPAHLVELIAGVFHAGLGALLGVAFKRFGKRAQIAAQLVHVLLECFGFRRLTHYNLLLR